MGKQPSLEVGVTHYHIPPNHRRAGIGVRLTNVKQSLGRPPRGGHFRVVAPVGGVRVGKAPLGPLVVTRSPTHLGDSPVPPVRGYTAAPVSHPAQRCSRSSPMPRNSNRSSDAHAATPDGSARALPFQEAEDKRHAVLRWNAQTHVNVVGHRMPFQHLNATLTTQLPQDGPDLPPEPSVEDFPAVFRYDHDVVPAL